MKTSIIITSYNYAYLLPRAIRSALDQTDCEVVVVDDYSIDDSRRILKTLEGVQNIKAIYHPENKGLPTAINTGIMNSLGMYIIRLDADDYLTHNKVNLMAQILDDNKRIDYVWGDYYVIDDNENIIGKAKSDVLGCNILFRRSKLEELNLYDEEKRIGEDRELFQRYLEKFQKGFHLPIPTYKFFIHEGSLTDGGKKRAVYCSKKESEI